MKCPECNEDLTKPGSVILRRTEVFSLCYNVERAAVRLPDVEPDYREYEMVCAKCQAELESQVVCTKCPGENSGLA